MTTSSTLTAGQYLSDFNNARMDAFAAASSEDIRKAFDNTSEPGESPAKRTSVLNSGPGASQDMIRFTLGMSAANVAATMGFFGAIGSQFVALGAIALTAGWLTSQAEQRHTYNKAVDMHESLQANAKNATSMTDMIQGQQDIIAQSRKDNEGNPKTFMQALGRQAVYLGIMACGIAAGGVALAVGAASLAGVAAVVIGATGLGMSVGVAHGQVVGQQKTDNMIERIAERTKNFADGLAARRENEPEQESMEPARPKNSF